MNQVFVAYTSFSFFKLENFPYFDCNLANSCSKKVGGAEDSFVDMLVATKSETKLIY